MSRLDDHLTDQFYRWEVRGRGWDIFEAPVSLEPRFRPFEGYCLPLNRPRDDGRKHTASSGFLGRLRQEIAAPAESRSLPEQDAEPEFELREPEELVEMQLSLPLSRSVPTLQLESFIRHVSRGGDPLVLEILGTERETVAQFVASPRAATRVRAAVEACFPGIVCTLSSTTSDHGEALWEAWQDSDPSFAVVELGLAREFVLPLGNPRDLLASVVAAMDVLGEGEFGLLQVMFESARAPWAESAMRAVIRPDGEAMFDDRTDLDRGLEQKLSSPLFGVVVRLVASAANAARAWELVADFAAPFSAFAKPGGNHLLPLHNNNYPAREHENDLLNRLSRRSGMLLNMEELASLIAPPVTATSRRLRRETRKTYAAPELVRRLGTLCLGTNTHAGVNTEVLLSPEQRVRHLHVIGASGTGKSTFLLNLIQQDIERHEGVAVLDPHGDLVDAILGIIPQERVKDVIVVDPSDESHSVGLNILAAHSDFERSLLASDLTSVFRRLSTTWGDQMESVLRNGILAFLESSRGGTLADLRRFLIDGAFRKEFLGTVTDPEIVYYWTKAFPQLTGGKSIGPVLTRLDEFLSRKPIRYMVSQPKNRIDFAEVLDRGKILLAKLPQGLIGRENTALLGSLITAKLQMAAMSRQRMPAAQRRDFWCYMDEFQNFITPSMAEILGGARKYRLGLILAHQELRHLEADRDVASAVLSNCCTRVVFKVGDADARALESGFSHFEARDLMNLGIGEAVCRVERSDFDFNLAIPQLQPTDEAQAAVVRDSVIASSRAKYSQARADIEMEMRRKGQTDEPETPKRPSVPAPRTPIETPSASEAPSTSETREVSETVRKEIAPTPPISTAAQTATSEAGECANQNPVRLERLEFKRPEGIPASPKDLGRGGAQHQAIQHRIKATAEELGFRAILERDILQGRGSVDVLLERPPHVIACEISITTTIDHEVGNVAKCFKADFPIIAVVSNDSERLIKIEAAVTNSLGAAVAERTRYFLTDQFFDYLRSLPACISTPSAIPEMRRGYRVKRKIVPLSAEEMAAREQEALRIIGENLRKGKTE